MKNIHVLPTDKPSRLLYFGTSKELTLQVNLATFRTFERSTQHIYITSDEEAKEGDYFLYDETEIRYKTNGTEYHGRDLCHISGNRRYPVNKSKKIILTTDQNLDGVQKIDDEFLQWFVKNPSCEEVEIRKEMYMPQSNGKISDGKITHEISLDPSQNTLPYYKIIIPKQEQCTCKEHDPYCCQIHGSCPTCVKKQETLEELAKEFYPDENQLIERIAFKRGYTECKERMYNEEDMIEFSFNTYHYISELMGVPFNLISENKLHAMYNFEQFKKK